MFCGLYRFAVIKYFVVTVKIRFFTVIKSIHTEVNDWLKEYLII